MTIEQRLAKLEKQNRWMKRVGGVMLAAVACVVLIAQGKAKGLPDLVVKSLTVQDADGVARIALGVKESGPFITIRDKTGKNRLSIYQTALAIEDAKGNERITLGASEVGSAVNLIDERGRVRAAIRYNGRHGHAYVSLLDETSESGVSLISTQTRGYLEITSKKKASSSLQVSGLLLRDTRNTVRAALTIFKDSPILELIDARGRRRAVLELSKEGSPSLHLSDKDANSRAVLGVTTTEHKRTGAVTKTAENTLTLLDAKGNVVWKAPPK